MAVRVGPIPQKCNVSNHGFARIILICIYAYYIIFYSIQLDSLFVNH